MRPTLAVLILTGVLAPALAQDAREEGLSAFFADLAEAAEAGDKAAYTDLFLPDATMFLPNRPPLLGRDQIGDWFDDFRQTVILALDSYEQEQVIVDGDVAMIRSRGIGHYLVMATEERVPFDQKYLDVLRYVDGGWRMVFHVASSSRFEPGLWDRDWEGDTVR